MESEFSERQILQTLFALSQSDGFFDERSTTIFDCFRQINLFTILYLVKRGFSLENKHDTKNGRCLW